MNTQEPQDLPDVVAQADALLAKASHVLDFTAALPQGIDERALRPLLLKLATDNSEQRRAEELRTVVAAQMALAHQQPGLESPPLDASPMTVFARQVRRRRTLV